MPRFFLSFSLSICLALGAVACGGADDDTPASDAAVVADAVVADAAPADAAPADAAPADAPPADAPPPDGGLTSIDLAQRKSCDEGCAGLNLSCVAGPNTPSFHYACPSSVSIGLSPRPCASVPAAIYESSSGGCNFSFVRCTCM